MLTLTKSDALELVEEALVDAIDMDTPWSVYAKAALKVLEAHGLTYARDPDAPCPTCGKPANTASCHMGGCPLGADL